MDRRFSLVSVFGGKSDAVPIGTFATLSAQSGHTPKHRGLLSADLAQRVARQFVEYPETLRVLIGCKPRRDVAEDFGNDRVPCRGSELYETEHTLTSPREFLIRGEAVVD
jgi:hypothetical protein